METYLYKFSACLVVFWLIYALFLEREKMHQLKRFYLLGAVILALVIPLLTITHYVEPIITNFDISQAFIPIEPSYIAIAEETPPFWDLEKILWLVYGLGVLLFSTRFIINLVKMYKRISNHTKVSERSFIYVLLQELRIPHSFFNYIFLNQSKYEADAIPKEVILHEETHAKQLHSIDILVIELLQIVFWFHPLVYILKHHIKLNHEFLADQAVLQEGVDTKTYQNILLQFSSNTDEYQLSSAINYSSIKKRFTVMKTQTSKTRIWLSSLLLLPIIAILFYSFAKKEYVEKENTDTVEAIKTELEKANNLQQIYTDGATEAMMKEYKDWIEKLNSKSPSLFIPVGTWERLVAIYDLMSEEQRNSVETHPILQEITPYLYSVKPSIPSTAQFESWKNEKEFAIWLDRKHISNSELNNYKINDIVHYTGSKAHSNARNQKFPQPFQFHLYTKDGYNKFYTQAYVSDYKEICDEYSIAIHDYLKGSQTDNSELRILKAQADKLYKTFTSEELKKHNILPAPPVPSEKNSKNKDQLVKFLTDELNQQKPIMWILINRNNQFLVDDEIGSLESIGNKLKKLAKQGKLGQLVSIKYDKETSKDIILEVERLIKLHKFKLASFNISPVMSILINRKDQLLVDDKPSNLKSIEDKLKKLVKQGESGRQVFIKHDKEASKARISKIEDLVRANNFKVATFDMSKITPPPPPTTPKKTKGGPNYEDTQDVYNPSFLEYIIEMEKEGASFYLDDKKITAKKARSIANNGERTEMITQKDTDGKYIVKLSSATKNKRYARSIELKVLNNNSYLVDGIKATKRTFIDVFNQQHQDITPEVRNNIMNIHVSSSKEISNKETWFIYNALQDYGFYRIVTPNQEINRAKGNTPFAIESGFFTQQKATKEEVAEYNVWAKRINMAIKKANENKSYEYPIIKQKDAERYIHIYKNLMTDEQRKNAEPLPQLPPPPPAPKKEKTLKTQLNNSVEKINSQQEKSGPVEINGATYYYSQKNGETTYFDKYGKVVDINKLPPPPPPTKAPQYKNGKKKTLNEIIKETPKGVESGYEVLENGESHYYTVYKGKKTYYNKDGYITNKKGDILPPPPPAPPAPESTLDFVIRMTKANAKFFYKLKPISSDKAIDLLKKNPKLHINAQKTDTREPLVYMSNKPIHVGVKGKDSKTQKAKSIKVILNGKTIEKGKLSMTRAEFKNIKLATKNGEVIEFKFKIPGKPTQTIKGNTLNEDAIKNLESVKQDDNLVLFAAKDGSDSKIEPLVIIITD